MIHVIVTEFMDEQVVRSLAERHSLVYDPSLHARPQDIVRMGHFARALIVRNQTRVNAALLDALPNLQVVGRLGVGLDNIDLDACSARGIRVCPGIGGNDIAVAEHVFAGLLALLKPSLFASASVAAGAWPRTAPMGRELFGKTLGIIGLGRIGRQVARRAEAFGLRVIACDPFLDNDHPAWRETGAAKVDLPQLLADSDAVSVNCPLNDSSRGLIDAGALARLRPGALLINTARGGIVDEAALAGALRSGHLAGALVDVFAEEPLAAGSVLAGAPNLILTAHVAGLTGEAFTRVSRMVADAVLDTLKAGDARESAA